MSTGKKAMMASLFIVAVACVLIGIASVSDQSSAAVSDTFTDNDLTYVVLTEDGASGTVSVAAANSFNTANLSIPSSVEHETVTYSVTQIVANGFSSKMMIRTVVIPSTVTTIGSNAFNGCVNLNSVTIGSNVTAIGSSAFLNCYRLFEVINNSGLTISTGSTSQGYAGYYAKTVMASGPSTLFTYLDFKCASVNDKFYLISYEGNSTTFTLPETINDESYQVWNYAFYGLTTITSVTIPNGPTSFGIHMFDGCTNLSSVTLPAQTPEISEYMFKGCTSLNGIDLKSTTLIGQYAFSGCTGLSSITIPDTVTRINKYAFDHCTGLTSFTFPSSIIYLEQYILDYCTNVKTINYNCTNVTTIFAGGQYNILYNWNFNGKLTKFTVNIGANVVSLPTRCFYYAMSGTFNLGNGSVLQSVGDYAFNNAGAKLNFNLPSTLTTIGTYAFGGAQFRVLENGELVLYSNLTSIADYAFYAVTVDKLTVQTSCTQNQIGIRATTIEFGGNATTITNKYFKDSTSVSYVTGLIIGESITTINSDVFSAATKLTSITVDPNNEKFSYDEDAQILYGLNNSGNPVKILRGFGGMPETFPATVTAIGGYAFYNSRIYDTVEIPSTVATVEANAFLYAYIEDLRIVTDSVPASMYKGASIGTLRFADNTTSIGG